MRGCEAGVGTRLEAGAEAAAGTAGRRGPHQLAMERQVLWAPGQRPVTVRGARSGKRLSPQCWWGDGQGRLGSGPQRTRW